jgi:hypothetical protein
MMPTATASHMVRPPRVGLPLALLMMGALAVPGSSAGQTTSPLWVDRPSVGESGELASAARATDERPPSTSPDAEKPARELVIAPIPIINPTLDNGVALAVGMLYPLGGPDPAIPPSASFLTGLATSNDSWAVGGIQTLHLFDDRYRVLAAGGYADVNIAYYGIGSEAGDAGRSVLLNEAGGALVTHALVRVAGKWYVGARYRLMKMRVSADSAETPVPVPTDDLRLRTGLLGPQVQRDTRDDEFYPRTGTLLEAIALFAGTKVGGERTYQSYQTSLSSYFGFTSRQVIASRVNACLVSDKAPFYDMCLIGQYQDLRGYPSGQYRDQLLLSAQTEYRLELWWRFGVVAFAGLGEVATGLDTLTTDAILPSGGAGLRFRVTQRNHLNLRADYAWGKGSSALYISIGEAF